MRYKQHKEGENDADANTTDIISKGEDKTRCNKIYYKNVQTSTTDSSKRKDDNTNCRSSTGARAISKKKDPYVGILDKALNVAAASIETAGSVLRTLQTQQALKISETTSPAPSTSGVSPRVTSKPDIRVIRGCAGEKSAIQQNTTLHLITRYILKHVKDNNSIKYYSNINLIPRNSNSYEHNVIEANNEQTNLQQPQPKKISKSKNFQPKNKRKPSLIGLSIRNPFDIVGKNFNKSLFNTKRKQEMEIKNVKKQKISPKKLVTTIASTTPSAKAHKFTSDSVDVLQNIPNTETSTDDSSNNEQGNSSRKEELDLNRDNNLRTDIISDSSNLILKRGSELLSQFRCYNTDLQNNISYPNCLYSGRMRDPRLPHNRIKYTNKSQASITLDSSSNSPKDPFNKLLPGHENIPCTVEPNIAENIVQTSVFVDTSIVAQPQYSANAFSKVSNVIMPVVNTVSTQNGSHDANDSSSINTNHSLTSMPHDASLDRYLITDNSLSSTSLQTDSATVSNTDKSCSGSNTPQFYATDSYVTSDKINATNPSTFTLNTSPASSLPSTSSNMRNCTVESSLPQKANLHAQNKNLAPGEFLSICRGNKPKSISRLLSKTRKNGINKEQSSIGNVSSKTVPSFEVRSKVNKSLTFDIDDTRSMSSLPPDPSTAANNTKSTKDSTRLQFLFHDVNEMIPKVPLTFNTQNGSHDANGTSGSYTKCDSRDSLLDVVSDNSLSYSFVQMDSTSDAPLLSPINSHYAPDGKISTLLEKAGLQCNSQITVCKPKRDIILRYNDANSCNNGNYYAKHFHGVQSNESNNLVQTSDFDNARTTSSPPPDPSTAANKSSSTKNSSSDKLAQSRELIIPCAVEPNITEQFAQTSVPANKCSSATQPEHFTDASSQVEIKISSISANTASSKSGDCHRNGRSPNPKHHKTEFIDHTKVSVSSSIQDQTDSTNVSNKTNSASTTPQLHLMDFASNGSIAKNLGKKSSKEDFEVHLNVTENLAEADIDDALFTSSLPPSTTSKTLPIKLNLKKSPLIPSESNVPTNNVQKPFDPIQSSIERDSSKNLADTSDVNGTLFTSSLPPSTAPKTLPIKLNLEKSSSIPSVSNGPSNNVQSSIERDSSKKLVGTSDIDDSDIDDSLFTSSLPPSTASKTLPIKLNLEKYSSIPSVSNGPSNNVQSSIERDSSKKLVGTSDIDDSDIDDSLFTSSLPPSTASKTLPIKLNLEKYSSILSVSNGPSNNVQSSIERDSSKKLVGTSDIDDSDIDDSLFTSSLPPSTASKTLPIKLNLEKYSSIPSVSNGPSNNVQSSIERDSSKKLVGTSDIDDSLFTSSLPPSTASKTLPIKLNLEKYSSILSVSNGPSNNVQSSIERDSSKKLVGTSDIDDSDIDDSLFTSSLPPSTASKTLPIKLNLEKYSSILSVSNGPSNNVQSSIERDASKNLTETSDIDDSLFTSSLPPSTASKTLPVNLNLNKSSSIPSESNGIPKNLQKPFDSTQSSIERDSIIKYNSTNNYQSNNKDTSTKTSQNKNCKVSLTIEVYQLTKKHHSQLSNIDIACSTTKSSRDTPDYDLTVAADSSESINSMRHRLQLPLSTEITRPVYNNKSILKTPPDSENCNHRLPLLPVTRSPS